MEILLRTRSRGSAAEGPKLADGRNAAARAETDASGIGQCRGGVRAGQAAARAETNAPRVGGIGGSRV